jgi:hypothetical protein
MEIATRIWDSGFKGLPWASDTLSGDSAGAFTHSRQNNEPAA